MSLENSLAAGWIQKQDPDPGMIAELLKISQRELGDSKGNISDEGRFTHAYNAALQAAVAALAAAGYILPKGQSAHVRAFENLNETAGIPAEEIDYLDACRRRRNKTVYDTADNVSKSETDELCKFSDQLVAKVKKYISENYPDLK